MVDASARAGKYKMIVEYLVRSESKETIKNDGDIMERQRKHLEGAPTLGLPDSANKK